MGNPYVAPALATGVFVSIRLAERYAPLWVNILLLGAYMLAAIGLAVRVLGSVWFPDQIRITFGLAILVTTVLEVVYFVKRMLVVINRARGDAGAITMWQLLWTVPGRAAANPKSD